MNPTFMKEYWEYRKTGGNLSMREWSQTIRKPPEQKHEGVI